MSKATTARWPDKTTTERVGSGTSNSTTVHRSASSGRFVTESTAKRNPDGTISQRV
ncbi:ABC transporter ATP-binding protein [Microbacterium sp. Yaish 1]|nr:ABC transporter ATP-binding protein [Microbacterium sp. Yaish 1]POX68641.1 ABC transporter ATP-binding protein [Microbacterium sp. Ru50]RAZ33415.1 ABC transporter ATP-binding protein [Microbacterium sp. SMR1]